MNKKLKFTLIILASLVVILFAFFKFMQHQTKKASPEATVEYVKDGKRISVFYCSPSKKGREIFGHLIPYGKVWRTGANEATTFTTGTELEIGDKILPPGKYTLWTIPEANEWTLIFNSKQYGWGVTFGGEASRKAEADVLEVKVPVEQLNETIEHFSIAFEGSNPVNMVLSWDKTRIVVPIK